MSGGCFLYLKSPTFSFNIHVAIKRNRHPVDGHFVSVLSCNTHLTWCAFAHPLFSKSMEFGEYFDCLSNITLLEISYCSLCFCCHNRLSDRCILLYKDSDLLRISNSYFFDYLCYISLNKA